MQESLVSIQGSDAHVAFLLSKAHDLASRAAPNTLRSYMADWQDFCEFAASIGVSALPADPSTVGCYLAERAGELRAATLGRRLSGIAFYHRNAHLDSPTRHPQVRAVFKGIKREYGAAQTFKRALLTPEIRSVLACCPDTLAGMRDRALWLLSYAAMTRRSETAAFRVEDITPSEPDGILVNIRKSKVDAESRGREVGIPYGEDATTCPILALRSYLAAARIVTGPVFRSVDLMGVCLIEVCTLTRSDSSSNAQQSAPESATSMRSPVTVPGQVQSASRSPRDRIRLLSVGSPDTKPIRGASTAMFVWARSSRAMPRPA